jgi:hypothetical protein
MQKVTPSRFIGQLILFVSLFALINAMVSLATRNTIPRQLLKGYQQAQANGGIDVLFVGHSLIEAGVDEEAFANASGGKQAYNLGMGWSGLVEHVVLQKHATKDMAKRGKKYDIIVYGLSNMMANRPPDVGNHGGNSAFLYYLEPEIAAHYYAHTPPEKAGFWLTVLLPYMQEKMWVWAKVEKLRRTLGGVGLPKKEANRFGAVEDFDRIESSSPEALAQEIRQVLQRPEKDFFHPIMEDMIADGKEHAARMIFVTMPKTSKHRRAYHSLPEWERFQTELTRMILQRGAEHIDAADWVPDTDTDGTPNFVDAVHLSKNGAKVFSTKLAQYLYGTPVTAVQP